MGGTDTNLRRKSFVALLSVVSNSTLVVLKLVVGFAISSVSVISEAIHSGVDLLAAVIAFVSVRTSGRPADEDHPFGHGKIENLSGAIEAILIFVAAIWIVREAVERLLHPPAESMVADWGIVVMLVSATANWVVSRMLMKVGKETDSIALRADAWHLRTDVYTSVGVMVGLGVIWAGNLVYPDLNLAWLDPVVAIGVALLIVKAAWDLTSESVRDLLDVRLPRSDEEWILALVRRKPIVFGFHGLRTLKAGRMRLSQTVGVKTEGRVNAPV